MGDLHGIQGVRTDQYDLDSLAKRASAYQASSRLSYTHIAMHEQHPVFEAPSDPDLFIWRYMDLAKFLSMLQDEALHFARADKMSDEFEGSTSNQLSTSCAARFGRRLVIQSYPTKNSTTASKYSIGRLWNHFGRTPISAVGT